MPPRVPKWPSQPSVLKTTPSSSLSDGSTASLRSAASGGTQIRPEAGATPTASEERQKLVAERENLITKLQEEAREKYLAELNLIAQKIRSIPLPSTATKSVS